MARMDVDAPYVRQLTQPSGTLSRPVLCRVHFLDGALTHILFDCVSGSAWKPRLPHHTLFSAPGRPLALAAIDRRNEQRQTYKECSPFSMKLSQMVRIRSEQRRTYWGVPTLGTEPELRYSSYGFNRGLYNGLGHVPTVTCRCVRGVRCPVCCRVVL